MKRLAKRNRAKPAQRPRNKSTIELLEGAIAMMVRRFEADLRMEIEEEQSGKSHAPR